MATVKIHEGTKFETPLDLQDDEGIVFAVPLKNKVMRNINPGCLWTFLTLVTLGIILIFVPKARPKRVNGNFVLTNKRIVVIPRPPNKKNDPVESFYWKDISKAKAISQYKKSNEVAMGQFDLYLIPGRNPQYPKGEVLNFFIFAEASLKNLMTQMSAAAAENAAANAAVMGATMRSFDEGVYTSKSLDKYYAAMEKRAKDRAKNLDFSSADHNQMRDYIVDVINGCVEEFKKG